MVDHNDNSVGNGMGDDTPATSASNDRVVPFRRPALPHKTPPVREPVLNLPPAVKALVFINIIFFLLTSFGGFMTGDAETLLDGALAWLVLVPARYTGGLPFGLNAVTSLVGHLFLHASWLHLAVNMGMLLAFGSALEKIIGALRMLVLYFLSGFLAAAGHIAVYPHSLDPLVGASGAISGLFGAVVMWMYDSGQMGRGWRRLMPLVAVWVGTSVFFGLFGVPGSGGSVAWVAHVAGFAGGMALYRPLARRHR